MFDLSILSRIPIDPGRLLVNLSLFDYRPISSTERVRRELLCVGVEVTITQAKTRAAVMAKRNRTIKHSN